MILFISMKVFFSNQIEMFVSIFIEYVYSCLYYKKKCVISEFPFLLSFVLPWNCGNLLMLFCLNYVTSNGLPYLPAWISFIVVIYHFHVSDDLNLDFGSKVKKKWSSYIYKRARNIKILNRQKEIQAYMICKVIISDSYSNDKFLSKVSLR